MPELPEVETVRRTLEPRLKGRRVLALQTLWPGSFVASKAVKDLLPDCFGSLQIIKVARRGKVLLLHLTSESSDPKNNPAASAPKTDLFMAFHLKMTGQVMVHPSAEAAHKHTRLIFDLNEADGKTPAGRLFFDDTRKFGYCRILTPAGLNAWSFWQNLGPEPLEIDATAFRRCFLDARGKPRSGKIKALLLDQSVIAGIGNIYADEALFRAGIAPLAAATSLAPQDFTRLYHAVREVLLESIAACGSSIRDYRDANGNVGAFQNTFRVYGRKGQACVTCATTLDGARVAGRATVFCPKCQS